MNELRKPVLILLILNIFILNVNVHAQNYWEDPNITGINKELPHAHYIPYSSIYQALDGVPSESPWYLSLNGTWKFFIRENLDEYMWFYFWEDHFNISDWDDIEVPGNWEL